MSVEPVAWDDEITRQLRARLGGQLAASGVPAFWRPAFQQIPRHHFMPRIFIRRSGDQADRYLPAGARQQRAAWLRHVYRDETVITQLNGDDTLWYAAIAAGSVNGTETCTSTQPSLMARMLEMLGTRPGHRVLEIGTGTGYNAAVLCHRLGDAGITSVDLDPALAGNARTALAALGYHPALAAADGRDGYPEHAPYDRIIATCSLPRLPCSWVQQAAPGARIIVTLAGLLGGALLLARTNGDGTATGHFVPGTVSFIPARPHPPGPGEITPQDISEGRYHTRTTALSPAVLDDPAFGFLAWLATADARPYWARTSDGTPLTCLIGQDGSWCEIYPASPGAAHRVDEGGPRRLWQQIEGAHLLWHKHGRPSWDQYGITTTPAQQTAWLGTPDGPTWELPPLPGHSAREDH